MTDLDQPLFIQIEHPLEESELDWANPLGEQPKPYCHKGEITQELRDQRHGSREQESSTCRGAGISRDHWWIIAIGTQPGWGRWQDLIWCFLPGDGQALGHGELLRGAEQESEGRSRRKSQCTRPPVLRS